VDNVSARDRLLASLFALQLGAAAVFGFVLVNALDDRGGSSSLAQVQATDGPPLLQASADPGAAAVAGTAGRPGTTGGSTSTTSGGPDAAGPAAGGVAGAGAAVAKGAPIKIGAVVTQTGAINFAASAQGTKAYIDMVNAQGGVNGRKILLDLRDDQLDPARGRQQAQQLLADGVFAFVGWNAPLTENGIVPFLEQNRVPLVGAYGQQQEYHSRYSFIFSASYGHYGFQMGRWLGEQKTENPGVIFIGNGSQAADDGLKAGFRAGLKSTGRNLPDDNIVVVDPTKPSYDDVVTQFRLAQVDGMATVLDQTAYNRLQQSMDRQSYDPVHVAVPLFVDPTVRQGASTEGTFVATDVELPGSGVPALQEYEATVRKAFGAKAQINYIGAVGWLDAKLFVDALRRMGDAVTREGLLGALERTAPSAGGMTAPLTFGPFANDTRDINRCLKIAKVVRGKAAPVTGWRCDTQPF
jgi:ABC-type branched-subunit amino acid transport system substrate-binding protein